MAKFGDSYIIAVDNIETIQLDSNTQDGFLGFINVQMDGVNQRFRCLDCLSSSSTMELGRFYLYKDDTPYKLPGTAQCATTCIFAIQRPLRGKSNSFFCIMTTMGSTTSTVEKTATVVLFISFCTQGSDMFLLPV